MKANPVPDGYHSVTPFIPVKGASRFLDFMQAASGAREMGGVSVAEFFPHR